MKKTITVLLMATIAMFLTANRAHTYGAGAPSGKTGSPGDQGMSCNTAYCHNGPDATEQTITITSNEVEARVFEITIEVQSQTPFQYQKAGFQACVENQNNMNVGQISTIDNTTTKIVEQHYITHTSTGTAPSDVVGGTHHLWKFLWTAPQSFTGNATVYAASMLTNNDGDSSGDVLVKTSHTIDVGLGQQELEDKLSFTIYPNPASENISFDVSKYIGSNMKLELVDIKGASYTLHNGILNKMTIDYPIPSSLAKGMYVVHLSTPDGQVAQTVHIK